jgi:hypothetical protein
VIETDEQRRWWFATHPEYSSSQKRGRSRKSGNDDAKSQQVSPKGVDAYVDRALNYVAGPVADLLKSVKRNFGTGGDSQTTGHNLIPSPGAMADAWMQFMGHSVDGGAFMPRVPTTAELSRWPTEIRRGFFRWLDAVVQNNPALGDPDKLEHHHGLPREFVKYFLDSGVEIEDFIIIMRAADHRYKPDGVHTGERRGGKWNREWDEFRHKHPAKKTKKHKERIKKKLNEMMEKYGIDKEALLSHSKPNPR